MSIVLRGGLRVASVPYRIAVDHRNRGYDSRRRSIENAGVPVISVGNLTTGGTGKTPVVCAIAKWFRARDVRVAIVSRGYGRGDNDANDEAMELAERMPDVPHVQDADRVEAARIAVEELATEVILMDDGFQHRRLHRDLDIVLIDATCPFGFGHTLPRGLLREPISGLRRAGLVIITRCDAIDQKTLLDIEATVRKQNANLAILRSSHRPVTLRQHPRSTFPISDLKGSRVAIVCAIGNPDAFAETARSCGAIVVDQMSLPDHDAYSPQTVAMLREWVRSLGDDVDQVVCTHKDLVKLRTDKIGGKPLAAIEIELQVEGDLGKYLSGMT